MSIWFKQVLKYEFNVRNLEALGENCVCKFAENSRIFWFADLRDFRILTTEKLFIKEGFIRFTFALVSVEKQTFLVRA